MKWVPLAGRLADWDRAISQRWQQSGKGRVYLWAVLGAHLGDGWVWVLTLVLALALTSSADRSLVWRWAISMAVAGGITTSFKFIWRRRRPLQRSGFYSRTYDRHSFPSGHATRMGTVAAFMPALFPKWGWLALFVVLWVGWSRVALGIHYLLDVAVGFTVGLIVSLIVLSL